MEHNNLQVTYVSGQTCIFTTSTLNKIICPDMHFQSQFNAPLEFPIAPRISGQIYIFTHQYMWPKLQNPYPQSVLGTGICHGTPARRDHPHIHATRNIVITLHIIHHLQSLLHPYAMGHCQPPHFHGLWNIRGGYCDGECKAPALHEYLAVLMQSYLDS